MSKFDAPALIDWISKSGHNGMLGMEYHAHGADWAELALPYRADLIGDPATGILASGPVITLMDMVSSIATWLKAKQFQPQATLDLRIDYLRPAEPGKDIIATAHCYKITRSIAFVRASAHDGDPDDPVATAQAAFVLTGAPV